MSERPRFYIAGIGGITALGANMPMTAALVDAKLSAYAKSDFIAHNGEPVTMAAVPDLVFQEIDARIGEGDRFNARHDRVIKMAIVALREACARHVTKQTVPLVLAMPEIQADAEGLTPFLPNLIENSKPWLGTELTRRIHGGRAAGIEAIDFAFRYLYDLPHEFILIGGSDSYQDDERLTPLADGKRLLAPGVRDGFVPGEAAGFLLLTRKKELALAREGYTVALCLPGLGDEPGHLTSDAAYRGDGLDQAFKRALLHHDASRHKIRRIYSSMNGEHYWAKEYGVAFIRNHDRFHEQVDLAHPAEFFGDVGAATAPILIALAVTHLLDDAKPALDLVYASADGPTRGAIVVEKVAV